MYEISIIVMDEIRAGEKFPQCIVSSNPDLSIEQWSALGKELMSAEKMSTFNVDDLEG
jgi:hypothetical protein